MKNLYTLRLNFNKNRINQSITLENKFFTLMKLKEIRSNIKVNEWIECFLL